MHAHDLLLLRTLVLAHGLTETLSGLSAVCSQMAEELAPTCAHRANTMMHISVELDQLAADTEFEDKCNAALPDQSKHDTRNDLAIGLAGTHGQCAPNYGMIDPDND